jgi:hypothetical protein
MRTRLFGVTLVLFGQLKATGSLAALREENYGIFRARKFKLERPGSFGPERELILYRTVKEPS